METNTPAETQAHAPYTIETNGRANAYLALGYRRSAFHDARAAGRRNAEKLKANPAAGELPYGDKGRTEYVPDWRAGYFNGTGIGTWDFHVAKEYAGVLHISGGNMKGNYSEDIPLPSHLEIESVGAEHCRSTGYYGDEHGNSVYTPVVVRMRVGKKIALAHRSPRADGILEEGERYLYAAGYVVAGECTGLIEAGAKDWTADKDEAVKWAHGMAEKAADENREYLEKDRKEQEEAERIKDLISTVKVARQEMADIVAGAAGRLLSRCEQRAFNQAKKAETEAAEALTEAGAEVPAVEPVPAPSLFPA